MNLKFLLTFALTAGSLSGLTAADAFAQESAKLTGTVIGTERSFDYDAGQASYDVNTRANAFDGDVNTFFASDERSHTWVGLDLGTPHIITRVGWSPRNDNNVGSGRVVLGLFEGANEADFSDATPIYIVKEGAEYGVVSHADVSCGKGFRYVRYAGPSDVRCNIAEVEFYGYEGAGEEKYATLTGLPTVVINTENGEEPQGKEKADEKKSTIKIISAEGELLSAPGTLRLRGNASMQFDKKPYRIKFDKKQRPLDAPAKAKKWTLINNYGDKTLIRNLVAWEICRKFPQIWTPYGRLVDVVVNGEYKGTYQLCDQVEVKEGRMPLNEIEPEDFAATDAADFDYFMEIDGYAGNGDPWAVPENWESGYRVPVTLKYPDPDDLKEMNCPAPYEYIKSAYQQMENAVMAGGFPDNNYEEVLDRESWLVHFLIGEITANPDMYWSTYMSKKAGDSKFYTGPEWDFDLGFGNDYRTYSRIFSSRWTYLMGTPAGANDGNGWNNPAIHNFARRILTNDSRNLPKAKKLFLDAIDNGLTANALDEFIDNLAAEIAVSQDLNFKRWKILDQGVHMNPGETIRGSYAEYIAQLKEFIRHRLSYIDTTSFAGVETDGIEGVATDSEAAVLTFDGGIEVRGATQVSVYNLQGMSIYNGAAGRIATGRGIFIVKADGRSYKALVD